MRCSLYVRCVSDRLSGEVIAIVEVDGPHHLYPVRYGDGGRDIVMAHAMTRHINDLQKDTWAASSWFRTVTGCYRATYWRKTDRINSNGKFAGRGPFFVPDIDGARTRARSRAARASGGARSSASARGTRSPR